ncbi:MAG: hypothetical protein J2P25_05240 [Nocardiopsaceae bacterium]|nr:hypothetical protein [Nocardiopsaceae bacterium]
MTNLTLTIDEDILRRTRIRALELGTSVNAMVRDYIRQVAGDSTAAEGIAEFFEATRGAGAGSGTEGRSWIRDDVYR